MDFGKFVIKLRGSPLCKTQMRPTSFKDKLSVLEKFRTELASRRGVQNALVFDSQVGRSMSSVVCLIIIIRKKNCHKHRRKKERETIHIFKWTSEGQRSRINTVTYADERKKNQLINYINTDDRTGKKTNIRTKKYKSIHTEISARRKRSYIPKKKRSLVAASIERIVVRILFWRKHTRKSTFETRRHQCSKQHCSMRWLWEKQTVLYRRKENLM